MHKSQLGSVPLSESDYSDWIWEDDGTEDYEPTAEDLADLEAEIAAENEAAMIELWEEQEITAAEWRRDLDKIAALGSLEVWQ